MSESSQTTQIACDCKKFKATLTAFPKNTPGRLVCYCKDCQNFLSKIDRADRLDQFGGTEVVPVYPSEIEFLEGEDNLVCHRLTKNGLYRWRTTCCNSPIANTKAGFPWVGLFHSTTSAEDRSNLGDVKGRIFGRDAKDGAPFKISPKVGFKDMLIVIPFVLKGKIFKKHKNSPFFKDDDVTPICLPVEFDPSPGS